MSRSHTSREFEAELREVRAQALSMGARCERSLRLALEAFWTRSEALAAEVVELDRQSDTDEVLIDSLVLRILALRQPVAYDLRFLTTALKLVTDLERIGDEAVNICERAREGEAPSDDEARELLRRMAEEAQRMVRDALDAFVEGEPERAEQVLARDDVVDAAYGAILARMAKFMAAQTQEIPAAIRVIKVAKYIERIADHATNIAEKVIFMVRGEDVRHVRAHPPPGADDPPLPAESSSRRR